MALAPARKIVFNTGPIGTEVFAAPVTTTGTAFESGVPQRLPFPPSTGVNTTPQSTPDGQRFLTEVPLDQTSGSNVNQRGAQLASIVEAVKPMALLPSP